MATVHRKGKQLNNVWSIDQVYAGIAPEQHCKCGHTASVHLITYQRTKVLAIKCDDCACIAYYPVVELSIFNGWSPDGK
jgi:hypothetical protein